MKWQHSNRTVRLALSLSIVSASTGLMPTLTSPGEPPSAALSRAHQRSHFAVIDPLYSATALNPAPLLKRDAAPWIYGEAELECWRLQVLRERMIAAKLNVGYPGVFHQALPKVSFRCAIPGDQPLPASLTLRAVGDQSSLTLSNVVVSGSGFSTRIANIQAGSGHRLSVRPRGDSGVRLVFDAGTQHIDSGSQGYFEARGGYRVFSIIGTNLSVSISPTHDQ
jgi:hypothetical protein